VDKDVIGILIGLSKYSDKVIKIKTHLNLNIIIWWMFYG